MPYLNALNVAQPLAAQTKQRLIQENDALRAELNDMRTKFASLLAKLDADAGVTDTNYASTLALAPSTFTRT